MRLEPRSLKHSRLLRSFSRPALQRLTDNKAAAFYCGDDPQSKSLVAGLVEETGVEAVDAGPLTAARFIEPAMMLLVKLAHAQGMGGKISYKLLR
jgi:8-hydroxy-5-deazaflavin:NADPH oxidoreductase